MWRAIRAIPLLMAIGPLVAPADQLPAYCGAVGAKSYTSPAVAIPAVVLNLGTVITVSNSTVVVNGDTSSVVNLMANPGPDGISLQEAIAATNNDPGTWNIQFAPALKGSTIVVDIPPSQGLQPLTGGGVTINGDIDGDGQPDITLTSQSGTGLIIYIISGGNTINGLALQNCGVGGCVNLRTPSAAGGFAPGPVATGNTFANTTISNLVMTNIPAQGSGIQICPDCGPTLTSPTGNTWDHLLITGNTITGNASGPGLGIVVHLAWGDTLQHTTIANNSISLAAQGATGVQFFIEGNFGPADTGSEMVLDTRVINNTVTAPEGIGFSSGSVGTLYDGVQVIGNQISGVTVFGGIEFLNADVQLGSGQLEHDNVMKNLAILANTIELIEQSTVGISIAPGQNIGATNNAISNVAILGNTILNTQGTNGIALYAGRTGATGQSLSNVLIQANTVQSLVPPGNVNYGGGAPEYAIGGAGISVTGGTAVTSGALPPDSAQDNSINGIAIANNDLNTPDVGIAVTGANGFEALASADDNVVAGAQIFCNQVDQIPTNGVLPSSGIKAINVTAGLDGASGNQVQQVYIADNLVAGSLGGASTFASLGTGASGNTLTAAAGPTPAISLVANAEGENPVIAPNTWIEIKGVNLAPNQDALNVRVWGTADFVNNQMPTQLDGVSVALNGKSAYLYYVNPSQVNVLTPPDAIEGPVNVVLNNNGVSSQTFSAQARALSSSFFVFDGTHIAATHLNGADIGPATLYPGLTTPASPGEIIVIYGNGFGQTSTPVVSGSVTQSGTLSPLPVITIGGVQATVQFAGLNITPGEFQFNVVVPTNLADGDQPITATYNGVTTQMGALLAVQR